MTDKNVILLGFFIIFLALTGAFLYAIGFQNGYELATKQQGTEKYLVVAGLMGNHLTQVFLEENNVDFKDVNSSQVIEFYRILQDGNIQASNEWLFNHIKKVENK